MTDTEEEDQIAVNLGPVECDRLCQQFAEITSTDSVVAMMYLQRNLWNLEGAVETFYNQIMFGDDRPLEVRMKQQEKEKEQTAKGKGEACETNRIKILSWNTDGLDESEPKARASCASTTILKYIHFALKEPISITLLFQRRT